MSSLRNAVQRRNHRERAQPTERSKWGLLEKRKDYKLRAADHKTKKRKLAALKQKAAARNEDEFYFAMVNSSTDRGVRRARRGEENNGGATALSPEVVALMKTQDQAYLQTTLQQTKNARARLQQEVILAETGVAAREGRGKGMGKGKIVFDEEGNGQVADGGRVEEEDDDFEDLMDEFDEEDEEDDDDQDEAEINDDEHNPSLTPEQRALRHQTLHRKRRKLAALAEQEEKLSAALHAVEQQRARMSGQIGGVNKNGVRFKIRERRR